MSSSLRRRSSPSSRWTDPAAGRPAPSRIPEGAPRLALGPEGSGTTLVIQTAFLGDVVLTTPLLTALARRHGPVDLLTTPAAAPLVESHPAVAAVLRYDKRGQDRGWNGFWKVAADLRRRRYERVYLAHQSWRSAALALAAKIPQRIGFAESPAALSYTQRRARPAAGHETARLLALLPDAGTPPPVQLGLEPPEIAAAEAWLAARGIAPPFVAVAPGSIWGTKRWPYYPELAAALDGPVVVVGGPDDAELGAAVAAAAPERVANAAGELGLRVAAALISRAAVLVTNDSAPLHLATAMGTPIVALFGPTVPAFGFGPLGPHDQVLEHPDLPCRPCSRHGPRVCPLGHHRCLRELDVAQVLAAVRAILAR